MPRLVLTVIGDDRAGLVAALSDVITQHDGNWEESQLADLAGKFAGIVVVAVAADRAAELTDALNQLDGLLEVTAHQGADTELAEGESGERRQLTIELLGNDNPGIVHDVSTVLARHDLSIDTIDTGTREAPMTGGRLFEAHIVVSLPADADEAAVRADLERLAAELMVDLDVTD